MDRSISAKHVITQNATLVAAIAIIIAAGIAFDNFFTVVNLSNIFRQASMIGIMAIGSSFVILTGGIDLSAGSLFGFAAVMCGIVDAFCPNPFVMGLIAILTCAGFGALNGFCVTKLRIPPFIVTLAMMSGVQGLGLIITEGGNTLPITAEGFTDIATGTIGSVINDKGLEVGVVPVPAIIMIVGFVIAVIVSKYTTFGRNCYAVGGNEDAAIMKGISVNRTKFLAYLMSGICCGIAGIIVAARTRGGQITVGDGYEMDVIASVVLGGTLLSGGQGKVLNSMWGALIITMIGNIINLNSDVISYLWEGTITGILLLVILVAQSKMQSNKLGAR